MKKNKLKFLCIILCTAVFAGCSNSKQVVEETEKSSETVITSGSIDAQPATEERLEIGFSDIDTESQNVEQEVTEIIETEVSEIVEKKVVVYTYTELNQTMYAKSSVNYRDNPSIDGMQLGKLKTNEEVHVTGQCNETGWYRIEHGDEEVYVSNNYLVTEPTEDKTVNSNSNSGNDNHNDQSWQNEYWYFTGSTDSATAWSESYYDAINVANGFPIDENDPTLVKNRMVKNKKTGRVSWLISYGRCPANVEYHEAGLAKGNGTYCFCYNSHHIPLTNEQGLEVEYIIMRKWSEEQPENIDYSDAIDLWIDEYFIALGYNYETREVDYSAVESEMHWD